MASFWISLDRKMFSLPLYLYFQWDVLGRMHITISYEYAVIKNKGSLFFFDEFKNLPIIADSYKIGKFFGFFKGSQYYWIRRKKNVNYNSIVCSLFVSIIISNTFI